MNTTKTINEFEELLDFYTSYQTSTKISILDGSIRVAAILTNHIPEYKWRHMSARSWKVNKTKGYLGNKWNNFMQAYKH